MKDDRADLVEDAEVHGSSVQINSTVMGMLLRIEYSGAGIIWNLIGPPPLFVALRGRLLSLGMVGFYQALWGGGLNQYQGAADRRAAHIGLSLLTVMLAPCG